MNIGFDAKRAFHNGTGLGHYSRTLLHSLSEFYPEHEYFLFNPKASGSFKIKGKHLHEILPSGFLHQLFPAGWRSRWVTRDLQRLQIKFYHGLSHEIPVGIERTSIKSVVTIHDLIHERYPEQYNPIDVKIYQKKFRYACMHANKIIAISEQTKKDIISYYKIPEEKITVCYQACDPAFGQTVSAEDRSTVKARYGLPESYFLYVGSVIERKNLLNICRAMHILKDEIHVPLVVIGEGGKYMQQVKGFIKENDLGNRIIFLSEHTAARSSASFRNSADFPAIYQSAIAMIYPSVFEGFGIPVLEALWSRLPVISSNVSSLPEAGGPSTYYVNPQHADEIAAGMKKIYSDPIFAGEMAETGWQYAQQFSTANCAAAIMNVYKSIW